MIGQIRQIRQISRSERQERAALKGLAWIAAVLAASLVLGLVLSSAARAEVNSEIDSAVYTGDGTTKAFPFSFGVLSTAQVRVVLRTILTGAEDLQVLNADYTLADDDGDGDYTDGPGGTVTFVTAPPVTVEVWITRQPDLKQERNLDATSYVRLAVLEDAVDNLTYEVQFLRRLLYRVPMIPETEARVVDMNVPAAPVRANSWAGWDANGAPRTGSNTSTTLTAAWTGIVQEIATAAQQVLGLAALGVDANQVPIVQGHPTDVHLRTWLSDQKLDTVIDVRTYGATGDCTGTGVGTDDTTAIKAAIAAAVARVQGLSKLPGGVTHASGTHPVVLFPPGNYRISAALTADTSNALTYVTLQGSGAALVPDSNDFTIFGGVGFMTAFKGLTIRGGGTGINLKTNNLNACLVNISDCEFYSLADACVSADATSNSTILNIDRCKAYQINCERVGWFLNLASVDVINMRSSWIETTEPNCIAHHGVLWTSDCAFISRSTMATAGTWIENYCVTELLRCRFGAENGGAGTIVRNYAPMDTSSPITPTGVSVRECALHAATNTIDFRELPNYVTYIGNYGHSSGNLKSFRFDGSLNQTDLVNFQKYGELVVRDNFDAAYGRIWWRIADATSTTAATAAQVFAAKAARAGCYETAPRERFLTSDVVGSSEMGSTGWAGSAGNASGSFADDEHAVQQYVCTATADGGYIIRYNNTYLSPTALDPNQAYTLILFVDSVSDAPARLIFDFGGCESRTYPVKGRGTICVPFVYLNNTGSGVTARDRWYWTVYLEQNGDVLKVGRQILVKGIVTHYDGDVLDLSGAAAPSSYTPGTTVDTGFFAGDTCANSSVSATTAFGWVCTAAGNAGTWGNMAPVWLHGSATKDPNNLTAGTGTDVLTVPVTNAAVGDFAVSAAPYALSGVHTHTEVSAAGIVTIRLSNPTGGDINLGSGAWRVRVMKQ